MTILKTLSSTLPEQITGVSQPFNSATFWGYKSFTPSGFPVNNGGRVFVGTNSGQCFIPVATGSYYDFSLNNLTKENLTNFYVQGASGDGVFVSFYP